MAMGSGVTSTTTVMMLPDVLIELTRETRNHPKLFEELKNANLATYEDGLAIIAAYCNVVLHGMYTGPDLLWLGKILLQKLQAMRGQIITS